MARGSSHGRELTYQLYNCSFALGSYDEADHPLVLAEFHKDCKRFFDDEEFWRYDMRCKLAVQKGLPLPQPFVRKIRSRHKGVTYHMGRARWDAKITLNSVQIRLGSWFTVGTKEERRTKDATTEGPAELKARDAYRTATAAPEQCWEKHLQSCGPEKQAAAKAAKAAAAAAAKQQKEQKAAKQQKKKKAAKQKKEAAASQKKRKEKECAEERKHRSAHAENRRQYQTLPRPFSSPQVNYLKGDFQALLWELLALMTEYRCAMIARARDADAASAAPPPHTAGSFALMPKTSAATYAAKAADANTDKNDIWRVLRQSLLSVSPHMYIRPFGGALDREMYEGRM
eukprot:SAG25_NODE_444_length_7964_cov_123.610807_6_plen_343_part_00